MSYDDSLKKDISVFCDKVKHLSEDVESDVINKYQLDLESFKSRLCFASDEVYEECNALLCEARKDLLSRGRMKNTEAVAAAIDPSKLEIITGSHDEGSYGAVYSGRLAGNFVAVKVIKNPTEKAKNDFLSEAAIMSEIRNEHVIRYLGATVKDNSVCIVMDWCDIDLKKISREARGPDPGLYVTNVVRWMCQAAAGLAWMHEVCVMIHRDVKPANILLKDGDAVVADFGFTKPLRREDSKLRGGEGSPYYKAPEIFRREPFSFPVDVYAFGVTLFEMLLGDYPYDRSITTEAQLAAAVLSGVRPDFNRLTVAIPASLKKLMEDCWQADPAKRPKMSEVVERLKAIYIETIVPPDNCAYDLWLKNFKDAITDSVSFKKFMAIMPEAGKVDPMSESAKRWRRSLLNAPPSVPYNFVVRLEDVRDIGYWYGDWIDVPKLKVIADDLKNHKWLVGFMTQSAAESAVQRQFQETKIPCFLVRCSKTKPAECPFTITCFDGTLVHHRVTKKPSGYCCLTLGKPGSEVVHKSNIFELIQALRDNGSLNAEPYGAYFSIIHY